jgi:hypothetical protein
MCGKHARRDEAGDPAANNDGMSVSALGGVRHGLNLLGW